MTLKSNRAHRISMGRKRAGHPIRKGFIETGIDQFAEGEKYDPDNSPPTIKK